MTRRESGFSRGSLIVKLPGERVGHTRLLVLDCSKAKLSYFLSADDALLDKPEGSCEVVGELHRVGKEDFALITESGEALELKGDAAELHRWAVAVAAVAAHAVSGYVWQQRKHKGRKKRWAYYQKLSGTLTLFKVDKRTGAPDWGCLRGTAAAEHAVRRRALAGLPFVFAVFCHSDKMFELSVRDAADLNRWLEILPTFVAVGEAGSLDHAAGRSHVISKLTKIPSRSVVGGEAVSPRGNTQQMLEAKVAQLEAMMKQAAKEKEEKEAKEEGAKEGPSGSAGLAALAWRGAAAAAGTAARGSMAAGAAAAAAGAGAEVEALSGSSEDDDDDDDEATQVGVSQEELESHGKPFLNAAERPLLRPSANEDADKGRRPAGQPGELAAMLAAMQAELAAVKDQNAKLIVQVGGEMGEDQELELLEAYRVLLREVVEMRSDGKYDADLMGRYNEAMVQLNEEYLRMIAGCFMQIYVDEVDESTLGFAEMMSIKLGELVDQPRNQRVQALKAEQEKKKRAEEERVAKLAKEREMAAVMAAQNGFNKQVFDMWIGAWTALSKGEADESESRRFKRRPELLLLLMTPLEMKVMSAYQWQNMSLGGLKPHELRGLAFALSKAGSVKVAETFIKALAAKLGKLPSEAEQKALCVLPAWAAKFGGKPGGLTPPIP